MKKYSVTVVRTEVRACTLEVEAENEKEAEYIAKRIASYDVVPNLGTMEEAIVKEVT